MAGLGLGAGAPAWGSASDPLAPGASRNSGSAVAGRPPLSTVLTSVGNAATCQQEAVPPGPHHRPFCAHPAVWECEAFPQDSQTLEETLGMMVFQIGFSFMREVMGLAPISRSPAHRASARECPFSFPPSPVPGF